MWTQPPQRAWRAVGLYPFDHPCPPLLVGKCDLTPPTEEQHVLRMIVKLPHEEMLIPDELLWVQLMMDRSLAYQAKEIGVVHPFIYITVRHGYVVSETDDEWHTDGFSTKITHLPEQNYNWVSNDPTQYVNQNFHVPRAFDPLKHNLHKWLAKQVEKEKIREVRPGQIWCFDPYVVHRRPPHTKGIWRTFVCISFTPIEIMDDANTSNPMIPMRTYGRDGVTIRNDLQEYSE